MKRKTKYPGVTQIGPGKYELRVQMLLPETRRTISARRWVRTDTVEQAAEILLRVRDEMRSSPPPVRAPSLPPRVTLGVYAKSWLERRLTRGMKPSTTARTVQVLEQILLPYFGSRAVQDIRKPDVETWLVKASRSRDKRGRLRATETVNGWLRLLKTILRDAVADLELGHDPTARVRSLSGLPTRIRDDRPNSLTVGELRRFLDAAAKEQADIRAMCVLGFYTGMRFGELSALTWNDIREDEGLIHIRRSQWHGKVSTTKTGKTRSAALHPTILDALRAHRTALAARSLPVIGTGLVFPSATAGYHTPSYLERPFRRILKAAKIEKHLSAHGMRRTFNNLMRQEQVDRVVLHATIGHSSEAMTEHYSHVRPEEKLAAVEKLVRAVGSDKNSPCASLDCRNDGPAPAGVHP